MKIQLYSDIHLESFIHQRFDDIFPYKSHADYLILAGDICVFNQDHLISLLDYVNENWKKTFFILGNHEFYGKIDHKIIRENYHSLFDKYQNVYLLDRSIYEDEDFIFVGCTLWAHFDSSVLNPEKFNIFKKIHAMEKDYVKPIQIDEYNHDLCDTDHIWLKEKLLEKTEKPKIIITHYPVKRYREFCPKKFRRDASNTFFMNDMDIESMQNVKIFISGHTHFCHDVFRDDARYISNQKGYTVESTNFKKDGLFDI